GETRTSRIIYIGWVDGPVQTVAGVPQRFKYRQFFDSPEALARSAFECWDEIEARCLQFERVIADASLPASLKQLLAFATHSYLVNTWWTTSPQGGDWFTVWEGCCQLHSTVDVEYNVAPFYLALWPDLLRMQLDEWVGHITDGVLSHDMGVGLEVNGMAYWHPMEVEENTNFVLLLHAYWHHSGDADTVRRHYERVRELLAWVLSADTDDDGFPEKGLYNTIDQGSPAIQYAPDQVYLAMRSLAACTAGAQMAELMGEAEDAARWLARAQLTARTLAEQGWLDDHYVVALNQYGQALPTGGEPVAAPVEDPAYQDFPIMDEGAGAMMGYEPVGGGYATAQPLSGWDSYSIYTTNGLVYPMRSGLSLRGLDLERLRADLRAASGATMDEFGSPHTSHENNMWVSQNIWRDIAAAYLGIDYLDHTDRYWDLQHYINTRKYGAFTDVYVYGSDSTSLDYYPRGVAAYGLIEALAGLQFDRVHGVVSLAPVRVPLRLPLTMFADWQAGTLPWLVIEGDPTAPTVRVEGAVPAGIEFRLRPRGEPFAAGERIEIAGG
ncbi:MAG: glycoside hydrolase family 52 protein, partial [Armatimonadota bacterium]